MAKRVMVFIDGSNLYYSVRFGLGIEQQVGIDSLSKKLIGDRELVRIYYYNTPSSSDDEEAQKAQQRFLDKLSWLDNVQVRLGRLMPREVTVQCPSCNKTITKRTHLQKGVDTRIAVDMVTLASSDAYDVAILVSGDSDLAEAVNYIRDHTHKKVENACVPGKSWAKDLREAADIRISLTREYLADCLVTGSSTNKEAAP